MRALRRRLSGWGRYPVLECDTVRPESYAGLAVTDGSVIARGLGRSYGDAALNDHGRVLFTERVNRMLRFDEGTGALRAEAGVSLADVFRTFVPRGWCPAVTPGTRQVTLGGCVAADVHGKNHHRDGSFSAALDELVLIGADGARRRCSPRREAETFWATVGGMGLTGTIGEVALRLRPIETAYLSVEHRPTEGLEQTLDVLQDPQFDDQYTVAWVDCLARGRGLGRGVFMRAHHARRDELPARLRAAPLTVVGHAPRRVPLDLPGWVLNRAAARAFNALYYRRQGARRSPFLADYRTFFHPLDGLADWNRLYGHRGFLQYQCVIPSEGARAGIYELIRRLADSGAGSFLAVLKRLGAANPAPLSFPLDGYTLALDLPLRGTRTLELLAELDRQVIAWGGRVYLAKDACLSPESFRAMYPRFAEWYRVKQALDPEWRFDSALARRLRLAEGP